MIDTYRRDSVNINTSLTLIVTHCGDGIDQAISDLILSHVFDDVKLSRSGFRDRHVCYSLQLVIKEPQDEMCGIKVHYTDNIKTLTR